MLTQKESDDLILEKLKILRERFDPAHKKIKRKIKAERSFYPHGFMKRAVEKESLIIATEDVETLLEYLTNDDVDVIKFEVLLRTLVG